MKKTNLLWGFILPVALSSCDSDNNVYDLGRYSDADLDWESYTETYSSKESVASNSLGSNMLLNLRADGQNTMYSPVSFNYLLAMLGNGADNDVQKKVVDVLGMNSIEDVNTYFDSLMKELNTGDVIRLGCENAMWLQKGLEIKQDYYDVLTQNYKATVSTLDFQSPSAKDSIDDWANKATNGLIPNLKIDFSNASAVLANACYFLADWSDPFSFEYKTEFKNGDGTVNKSAFGMNTMSYFPFASKNNYKAVRLTFRDRTYCMDVVLPNNDVSTTDVLKTIDWNNVGFTSNMLISMDFVNFKAENQHKISEQLPNLGLDGLFNSSFEKIADGVEFNRIQQNTFIQVDAKGTKAAAVSVADYCTSAGSLPTPVIFKVDRPFLFAIRNVSTGLILYMGDIEKADDYYEKPWL